MAQEWSLKLEEGEKITAVMIRHGSIVEGIGFEIADKNGKNTTKQFPNSTDGTSFEYISLDAEDYITQISGTYGKYNGKDIYIATIKVHTNLHPYGYGPYGGDKDIQEIEAFSTPLPLDGPIVEFFGSYDPHLASIGIYAMGNAIERYGPYGNNVGLPKWSTDLDEGYRFSKIVVHNGYVVDGVGFEVTDANGNIVETMSFSGPGGSSDEIALGPTEYVTKISGEYGYYYGIIYITSIKVHTNLRPSGYGPYGQSKDVTHLQQFSTPLLQPGDIVGFSGTLATYLGSIGIQAKCYEAKKYGPYGRP